MTRGVLSAPDVTNGYYCSFFFLLLIDCAKKERKKPLELSDAVLLVLFLKLNSMDEIRAFLVRAELSVSLTCSSFFISL